MANGFSGVPNSFMTDDELRRLQDEQDIQLGLSGPANQPIPQQTLRQPTELNASVDRLRNRPSLGGFDQQIAAQSQSQALPPVQTVQPAPASQSLTALSAAAPAAASAASSGSGGGGGAAAAGPLSALGGASGGFNTPVGGAASGAAIGTSIMPGWGTVIGAAGGLLVGIFSGMAADDKEKKAKRLEAAKVRFQGIQRSAEVGAQQQSAGVQNTLTGIQRALL